MLNIIRGVLEVNSFPDKVNSLNILYKTIHTASLTTPSPNKIANNFVRIINKIIIKRKKIEIFQKFYNNLKKIYYLKGVKPNYLESKYDKDDPKYKEYKDMIYNYIKSKDDLSHSKIYNILKPEDKMKFNTINAIRKNNSKFKIKEENSSSNNTSIITEKKSAIQRFKQLQKK